MARIARITVGFALIVAGSFMLFLPGPGILTIIAGLALLSEDLKWAGKLAAWMRSKLGEPAAKDGAQAGG